MPSCEKCWSEAHRAMVGDPVALYQSLVETHSCTPEEQAGPDAGICGICNRYTLHEHTHSCTNPKCENYGPVKD